MRLTASKLFALSIGFGRLLVTASPAGGERPQACSKISRDVVILGGGSSGTYTAVGLVKSGRSVAVIDAANQLGGHVQTYEDPVTGRTIDTGARAFYNNSITWDYWKTIGVEPVNADFDLAAGQVYFDHKAGKVVTNYVAPNTTAALQAFRVAMEKFPELIDGYDALPHPVPADILLPFGQFAEKYGFLDAAFTLAYFGQGGVDYINVPTLYVAKYLGLQFLESFNIGQIVPSSRNNHEIYAKAGQYLGLENVYLHTRVQSSKRNKNGVTLRTLSSDKKCTIINAKKMVVAVPPILSNLAPLDLDKTETKLFSRISGFGYFGALVRYPNFPVNATYTNFGSDTKFNFGHLPNALTIMQSTVKGLIDVKYGAGYNEVSRDDAKAGIIKNFNAFLASLGDNRTAITEADFVKFASYGPYMQHAPAKDVADGIYKKLWALQGKRSTFFNGAAWQAQDSGIIWNFTEHRLLPLILKDTPKLY